MSVKAGGLKLDNPIIIAAGVCKNPKDTLRWMQSIASAVVSGSYTEESRPGNDGTVIYPDNEEQLHKVGFGLNSLGLPNMGIDAAIYEFKQMRPPKPIIASVAANSVADFAKGLRKFAAVDTVAARVANLSCPNVHGVGSSRIICFELDAIKTLCDHLEMDREPRESPVWIKVSPYSDPYQLKEVAEILNETRPGTIRAVVTCNTFPNGFAADARITPNDGLAGLSGPAIKPIALGQVKQWRKHLRSNIDVIGVGGITTGNDIADFLDVGAAAIKVNSLASWSGNPRALGDILFADGTSERFQEKLRTFL